MKIVSAVAAIALASLTTVAAGMTQTRPASAAPQAEDSAPSGEALFIRECGMCHLPGGTGTMMLERRLGEERALIAQRWDLPPQYIELAVRQGVNSMPTITRVELPDAELHAIIDYLTDRQQQVSRGAGQAR